MGMKLIETTVSEKTVRMQLANDADPEKATEWLEFEVPVAALLIDEVPVAALLIDEHNLLGDPAVRRLAIVQRAALHHLRVAIDEEIQSLASRNP